MNNLSYLVCLVTATCMMFSGALSVETVCYEPLGCFSNNASFRAVSGTAPSLPKSPEKIKTIFILYTRVSDTPQYLDALNSSNALAVLTNLRHNKTKFIIHGFVDSPRVRPWMKKMAVELLKYGDYNVFIVDWSEGNRFPYAQAAANARVVGAQIAYLVKFLIAAAIITAGDVHIIGHSLGAPTAGYAGERIPGCGRITGLDPALIFIDKTPREVRLDPLDALFVDIIYTLLAFAQSLFSKDPFGHATFYPNGGTRQPGCGLLLYPIPTQPTDVNIPLGCDHDRAHEYFTESINSNCPFTAHQCASEADFRAKRCTTCDNQTCSRMGFHADKNKPAQGQIATYYLKTAANRPFCLNDTAADDGFLTGLSNIFL